MQIPSQPLARSLAIFDALRDDAAWSDDRTVLRYAATTLATAEHDDVADLARRARDVAAELASDASWFGPLRGTLRHCVAAMLVTHRIDAAAFLAEVGRTDTRLRALGVRRGHVHEILATLVLMGHGTGRVTDEQLARFAEILDGMRAHHPWITGADDYPACALLVDAPRARLMERVEHFYASLRALGFRRGNALQYVSHLLILNPAPDDVAIRRFADLYAAFRDAGLWMHTGDYDEVAMLTFLDEPVGEIVRRVSEHRDVIAAHRPRPGKELSFDLACTTVLIELLRGGERVSVVNGVRGTMAAQALIASQNAAAITAATAGAAAASAAASASS